jgi:hypothetical protein
MSEFMSRLAEACSNQWHANIGTPLLRFVTHGDRKALETAKKNVTSSYALYWFNPWEYLGPPAELSEEEKRAMEAAVYLGEADDLAKWLKSRLEKPSKDDDDYLAAYLAAFGSGKVARVDAAIAMISAGVPLQHKDTRPSVGGDFLLSLGDAELMAAGKKAVSVHEALEFLIRHASQRVASIAVAFLREGSDAYRSLSDRCCRLLLEHDAKSYQPIIEAATAAEKRVGEKATVVSLLAAYFPDKYLEAAKELNLQVLTMPLVHVAYAHETTAFQWLASQFGTGIMAEFENYLSTRDWESAVKANVQTLASVLGERGASGVIAATRHPAHDVRLEALSILIGWNNPAYERQICVVVEAGFSASAPRDVVRYVSLAARWRVDLLAEPLWKLFDHKSKPVRAAAARALGRLGDAAVSRACDLLVARKAATRSAAVSLLAAAQTPVAAQALEARLDDETDEEVRDQILLALDQVWEAQGKKITRKQIDQRIARAAEKLQKPVVDWIDEKKLPALCFAKDGENLKPETVRYLLYRQMRVREIRPDIECKPLYALIDCKTSGDFALAVLQSFLASKMRAEDRWALALAGILGDDRIVAMLMNQIRVWVDANRGKLAEYAAQALALLGSDVALCAVDALSIRYRSKQKNIGKAAAEAFAEAAERQGITVDELGDRVVPWLDFERGQPRLIEKDDKRIEVRIGLDFKLEFRDLAKGKKIASLPSWVSKEAKDDYKYLAATLREVLKGQLVRIENLMVRQFRWPLGRWRELFLVHPVLLPFAVRLVWGIYEGGQLQATFRALEDRTLTNAFDEAVTLSVGKADEATIGIVHPLELSAQDRQAWGGHLADYNIQSPFLQLERPVVYPTVEEKAIKMSTKYKDTDLNAMTFKGRAERLGWQRGSVCDGGGITSYYKSFPGAGADVILAVEGMFIGIGMEDSIRLGCFCFVNSGSVSTGSYVYDEPNDEKDPRLLAFGDVPPIVFSETLGDLAKITGKIATMSNQ